MSMADSIREALVKGLSSQFDPNQKENQQLLEAGIATMRTNAKQVQAEAEGSISNMIERLAKLHKEMTDDGNIVGAKAIEARLAKLEDL